MPQDDDELFTAHEPRLDVVGQAGQPVARDLRQTATSTVWAGIGLPLASSRQDATAVVFMNWRFTAPSNARRKSCKSRISSSVTGGGACEAPDVPRNRWVFWICYCRSHWDRGLAAFHRRGPAPSKLSGGWAKLGITSYHPHLIRSDEVLSRA
jgi:hypothetical protein